MANGKKRQRRVSLGNDLAAAERRRKIATLRYVQKWAPEEIAQALGISKKTVERDLSTVRQYGQACGAQLINKTLEEIAYELELAHDERQKRRWTFIAGTDVKNPRVKSLIINDSSEDTERHIRTLQSLGVLPKVQEKLKVEGLTFSDIMSKANEYNDEQDKAEWEEFGRNGKGNGNGKPHN